MFFLQFAIHFDDFAKRQEFLILEETEIMLVESAVLWQEWLARLFYTDFYTLE